MTLREKLETVQFYRAGAGTMRHPHSDEFGTIFPSYYGLYPKHDCHSCGCKPVSRPHDEPNWSTIIERLTRPQQLWTTRQGFQPHPATPRVQDAPQNPPTPNHPTRVSLLRGQPSIEELGG